MDLDVKNNMLPNLDVSDCTELEILNCNDNALTMLDVSGCPALKHPFRLEAAGRK